MAPFAVIALLLLGIVVSALAVVAGDGTLRPGGGLPGLRLEICGLAAVTSLFAGLIGCLLWENRKLQRQAVELSRLALVAQKTDQVALMTTPEGLIDWVSDGFPQLTGYTATEAVGKAPGSLLLGPLHNINVIQKIRDAVANERPVTVEMLCQHKRGHRYNLRLSLAPVFDEQKRLTSFVAVGTDNTARRKTDGELDRLHRRNELYLNAAGDGIFGLDLQGHLTFANPAAATITGWDTTELIGQPVSKLLHQIRVSSPERQQDDLFTGAAFIDGTVAMGDCDEFRRRDGIPFPVEYTSTPMREGDNLLGSVVVFRDISDRRQSDRLRAMQTRQFALRAEVAFGLTACDGLRSFLQRAMLSIVKSLDGSFARVWWLNPVENVLELQASAGLYTHTQGPHSRIPVGTLKVGKIAVERAPVLSHNLMVDPDIIDKEWVLRERMASFIGFPLFVEGRLVGVMAMFSQNRLPEDAIELLACVTDTIAQGTVRKRAEEKITEQAALLDQTNDAIIVIDLNDRCAYWNKPAERLHGLTREEVGTLTAGELVFKDHAYYERAKALTWQQGEFHDAQARGRRVQETVAMQTRWTLLRDEQGRPRSILLVNTPLEAMATAASIAALPGRNEIPALAVAP